MRVLKRNGFTLAELRPIIERVSAERYDGNVILDTYRTEPESESGTVVAFKLRCFSSGYVWPSVRHVHTDGLGYGATNPFEHTHETKASRVPITNLAKHLREDHPYLAPGARKSAGSPWSDGHRTVAACWHSYRDVLRAVFEAYPRATIITSMARYEGLEGFEATYSDTAYRNVGSQAYPAYMPELCNCVGEL